MTSIFFRIILFTVIASSKNQQIFNAKVLKFFTPSLLYLFTLYFNKGDNLSRSRIKAHLKSNERQTKSKIHTPNICKFDQVTL